MAGYTVDRGNNVLKIRLNLERRSTPVTCRLLAPPSGQECALTNLEVLVLVFVAVTHMSFQLSCVEETQITGRDLAPTEGNLEMSDWRGAPQYGGTLTHLNCLAPVC